MLFTSWAAAAERKVKVTVLPFSIYSAEDLSAYERDIQEVLLSALAYHERIDPLDLDKLSKVVAGKLPSEMDENYAREVGRKMGADYVVIGSMTKVGETISLDARLVDPRSREGSGAFLRGDVWSGNGFGSCRGIGQEDQREHLRLR